jgi:methylthioribose-1-phosphate isomerase
MSVPELSPILWRGSARDGELRLLDQRLLPGQEQWVSCKTIDQVAQAIREMVVRGAPAIGITAAYGMVVAAQDGERRQLAGAARRGHLESARRALAATRPTAVNLFWVLEQCRARCEEDVTLEQLLHWARQIHDADVEGNRRMGVIGADRLSQGMGVLTHCNAGALATGGVGTAIGVLTTAHRQGKNIHVYVDETRPRLQGARLTAWELSREGIPYTLICDGMAASLMSRGRIQACIVGADRIAANGDVANKVGTYGVAVNAHYHEIPFYVAAPVSTFDLQTPGGDHIPIEERAASEVTQWGTEQVSPEGAVVYNPAFDVTPNRLVAAIFTEIGEISPVNARSIAKLLSPR